MKIVSSKKIWASVGMLSQIFLTFLVIPNRERTRYGSADRFNFHKFENAISHDNAYAFLYSSLLVKNKRRRRDYISGNFTPM
jgi:hypothetical protein